MACVTFMSDITSARLSKSLSVGAIQRQLPELKVVKIS